MIITLLKKKIRKPSSWIRPWSREREGGGLIFVIVCCNGEEGRHLTSYNNKFSRNWHKLDSLKHSVCNLKFGVGFKWLRFDCKSSRCCKLRSNWLASPDFCRSPYQAFYLYAHSHRYRENGYCIFYTLNKKMYSSVRRNKAKCDREM